MIRRMGKPGLYQIGKGRKPKRRTRASLADLAEAASTKKRKNHPGNAETLTNCRNIASLWGQQIPKGRQCSFTHKTGKRCGCWAMRGARYCWKHGGLLDVPNHPSAVKALPYIEAEQAHRAAQQEIRKHDPHTVELIRQSIIAKGYTTAQPGDIIEGVKAYNTDDNGRAYRRWLGQLTKPADQQRARKKHK